MGNHFEHCASALLLVLPELLLHCLGGSRMASEQQGVFFSPLCSSVSLLAVRLALLTHSYHQQRCFGVGLAEHRLLALQLCR